MKHSRRSRTPRGYSRGRDNDTRRSGPIMIEDIMKGEETHNKSDMSIREMTFRTDPTNPSSPTIKRKFKPLDNPDKILDVLAGILTIKQGIVGNNVTTGPLQFAYWRGCITGTALSEFNQAAIEVGNETIGNLQLVERKLVKFFMPREVLRMQTSYMRLHMKKPKGTSTRQYVGAVKTLNEKLVEMPPNFSTAQKLPASDIMHIMVSRAPQAHKDIMREQGFDPETATTNTFVELCERAENKESEQEMLYDYKYNESDYDDSGEDSRPRKPRKKPKQRQAKTKFYCKEHGPNNTHVTADCNNLNNPNKDKDKWKKKKPPNAEKYKDYKSKYQKKHAELNILEQETKKEKAKWIKAHKKQLLDKANADKESQGSDTSNRSYRYKKAKQAIADKESQEEVVSVESSSSSSSNSESE
jgi:hypothetical protein